MILCLCNGITEQRYLEALKEAGGDPKEIARHLGVGQDCGICMQHALKVSQRRRHEAASRQRTQDSTPAKKRPMA